MKKAHGRTSGGVIVPYGVYACVVYDKCKDYRIVSVAQSMLVEFHN